MLRMGVLLIETYYYIYHFRVLPQNIAHPTNQAAFPLILSRPQGGLLWRKPITLIDNLLPGYSQSPGTKKVVSLGLGIGPRGIGPTVQRSKGPMHLGPMPRPKFSF